jgi:hypothetical protein
VRLTVRFKSTGPSLRDQATLEGIFTCCGLGVECRDGVYLRVHRRSSRHSTSLIGLRTGSLFEVRFWYEIGLYYLETFSASQC